MRIPITVYERLVPGITFLEFNGTTVSCATSDCHLENRGGELYLVSTI